MNTFHVQIISLEDRYTCIALLDRILSLSIQEWQLEIQVNSSSRITFIHLSVSAGAFDYPCFIARDSKVYNYACTDYLFLLLVNGSSCNSATQNLGNISSLDQCNINIYAYSYRKDSFMLTAQGALRRIQVGNELSSSLISQNFLPTHSYDHMTDWVLIDVDLISTQKFSKTSIGIECSEPDTVYTVSPRNYLRAYIVFTGLRLLLSTHRFHPPEPSWPLKLKLNDSWLIVQHHCAVLK